MKFKKTRIPRDRKRSPQEIAEWVNIIRQRDEQRYQNRLLVTLKVGRIAALSLIIINIILFFDVYLLPSQTRYATITEANLVSSRGSRSFNIHISTGKYWTVENTGYENNGVKLSYQETTLFKIGYRIRNLDRNARVLRSYDALRLSKIFSILFIVLGLSGFVYKPIGKNEFYASIVTAFAVGQDILLLL